VCELDAMEMSGECVCHPNQVSIGRSVHATFADRAVVSCVVVAPTQSGKTGSMVALIREFMSSEVDAFAKDADYLSPSNVYVITGLSSCAWRAQTASRMPGVLRANVYHGANLAAFVREIQTKTNVLIIMDEIQIAAKPGQRLHAMFRDAGLLDLAQLYARNVKVVEYSATPDGVLYDAQQWGDASRAVFATAGKGYVGAVDMLYRGQVRQCNDLEELDNVRTLAQDMRLAYGGKSLYHIVRTHTGAAQRDTIANFRRVFGVSEFISQADADLVMGAARFLRYDQSKCNDIGDLNTLLATEPVRPTFIFIKEMLRCAKTIQKTYVGVLYDRLAENPDDASVIQGLVGRNTGYDTTSHSICYTNMASIDRYAQLWNSEFTDCSVAWKSKTTRFKKGELESKSSFNDTALFTGFPPKKSDLPKVFTSKASTDAHKKLDQNMFHSVPVPIIIVPADVTSATCAAEADSTNSIVDTTVQTTTELESDPNSKFEAITKVFDTQEELKAFYMANLKTPGARGPTRLKPRTDGYFCATVRSKRRVYSMDDIMAIHRQGLTDRNFRVYPCYTTPENMQSLKWVLAYKGVF
jgi:hypothetical protein